MALGDFQDYSNPNKNNFTRVVQNNPSIPQTTMQGLVVPKATTAPTSYTNQGKMWANSALGTGFSPTIQTADEASFMGMNPNATLGANGEWSGLSTEGSTGSPGLGWAKTGLDAFNAYNMYQQSKLAKEQLGLAREQFGFEKAATNRSLQNQASQYNTGLQNSGEVGMALAGSTMDANAMGLRQAQLDAQKISTAAIG